MVNNGTFPLYTFLTLEGVEVAIQMMQKQVLAQKVRKWFENEVLPNYNGDTKRWGEFVPAVDHAPQVEVAGTVEEPEPESEQASAPPRVQDI